MYRKLKVIWRG